MSWEAGRHDDEAGSLTAEQLAPSPSLSLFSRQPPHRSCHFSSALHARLSHARQQSSAGRVLDAACGRLGEERHVAPVSRHASHGASAAWIAHRVLPLACLPRPVLQEQRRCYVVQEHTWQQTRDCLLLLQRAVSMLLWHVAQARLSSRRSHMHTSRTRTRRPSKKVPAISTAEHLANHPPSPLPSPATPACLVHSTLTMAWGAAADGQSSSAFPLSPAPTRPHPPPLAMHYPGATNGKPMTLGAPREAKAGARVVPHHRSLLQDAGHHNHEQ